jgi:hypothetical protein
METQRAIELCGWLHKALISGAQPSEDVFALCESPSERQFLLGFFLSDVSWYPYRDDGADIEKNLLVLAHESAGLVFLYLQKEIEIWWDVDCRDGEECAEECVCEGTKYRVDFMFEDRDVCLIVEIDGHDFHERTKEQAARDRQRDRALISDPNRVVQVMRFTGSEVFEHPGTCFSSALYQFLNLRRLSKSNQSETPALLPAPEPDLHT